MSPVLVKFPGLNPRSQQPQTIYVLISKLLSQGTSDISYVCVMEIQQNLCRCVDRVLVGGVALCY